VFLGGDVDGVGEYNAGTVDVNVHAAMEQAMNVADQTMEQKRKLLQTSQGKAPNAEQFPTARKLLVEKKRYA
jgi:hypothetical protein